MAKYNKRRNTYFLFNILLQEEAKHLINKDMKKYTRIKNIVDKNFTKESEILKDLKIYKIFEDYKDSKEEKQDSKSEKLLLELLEKTSQLNKEVLFSEQTTVIYDINKENTNIFGNKLNEYKTYATLNQFLLFESEEYKDYLNNYLTKDQKTRKEQLLENINKKFSEKLNKEISFKQKKIIKDFIFSLNEDIILKNLKKEFLLLSEEITNDISKFNDGKEEIILRNLVEEVKLTIKILLKQNINKTILLEKILKFDSLKTEIKNYIL